MSQSKQYAIILRTCADISKKIKDLKKTIGTLMSIQAATTAELNMLKERFDISINQQFIAEAIKNRPEPKKE